MTNYRATPEQWDVQEKFAPESEDAACLLELRARVERLELGAGIRNAVAEEVQRTFPGWPDRSLVERVQRAIHDVEFPHGTDEARAAIREVAAWLREFSAIGWAVDQALFNLGECTYEDMAFEARSVIAELIEREAARG